MLRVTTPAMAKRTPQNQPVFMAIWRSLINHSLSRGFPSIHSSSDRFILLTLAYVPSFDRHGGSIVARQAPSPPLQPGFAGSIPTSPMSIAAPNKNGAVASAFHPDPVEAVAEAKQAKRSKRP